MVIDNVIDGNTDLEYPAHWRLKSMQEEIERIGLIPGISRISVKNLLAEIGVDMGVFLGAPNIM